MSIASLGVGSKLDLGGLLDQLAAAESRPLVALQKQQISYTAKLSAYGTLQGALSGIQSAAARLADAAMYLGMKSTSSATDVVTASAAANAATGSYSVEVTALAQAQSLATAGVADSKAAIGKGRVTLDFGTVSGGTLDPATGKYSGASFAPDAGRAAKTIVVDDGNNSLEGLRDTINNTPGLGVTASIVNAGGATPYRLVLNSTQTGQASSMRLAVDPDAEAGLQSLLGHDPSGTQGLQQTCAAADATLKINGIAVTSATNTVKDAVQGVTMTLAKTGVSTLAVSRDVSSVESAIGAFVAAYNSLQGTAAQLTKYDTAKKSGAPLVGDSALRTIQTGIRSALNTPQAGALKVLSRVGVSFQTDGTMAFDPTKLRSAMAADPAAVSELFAGTGASTGYGNQLAKLVGGYTGTDGSLSNATVGVKATLKSLDQRYAKLSDSVEAKVAHYRAQFNALDQAVAKMNSTSSYLTAQFDAMSGSRK
jgi:flagellar hook-associated protein 2